MLTFGLPSVDYVEALYNYLQKIIPGLTFFRTMKVKDWLYGYYDPFGGFVASMNVYEGGTPLARYLYAAVGGTNETGFPKNQVYSGRLDTEKTKTYNRYMNRTNIYDFTTTYDEYSPTMKTTYYKQIWRDDVPIRGGDGGTYGTQVSDSDILAAFIPNIRRYVNLTFVKDKTYKGLDVSRFETIPGTFNTSATVKENAVFYQDPTGYDGFINISKVYDTPVFICTQHCYLCSDEALDMFEQYKYSSDWNPTTMIFPSPEDANFAEIEPLTGTGVDVLLNFDFRVSFKC